MAQLLGSVLERRLWAMAQLEQRVVRMLVCPHLPWPNHPDQSRCCMGCLTVSLLVTGLERRLWLMAQSPTPSSRRHMRRPELKAFHTWAE